TRLACWFRRHAETIFSEHETTDVIQCIRKVRDSGTPSPTRETRALPGSLRSPDLPAIPVVKSLFLAFDVPILNHLDTFPRYHPPAHHSFQRGQESVDLLFAIDDFNDK